MHRRGVLAGATAIVSAALVSLVVAVGYGSSPALGLVQPDGSRDALVEFLAAPHVLYAPSGSEAPRTAPPTAADRDLEDRSPAREAFEARFPAQASTTPVADDRVALLIGINRHLGTVSDNQASRQDAERLHALLLRAGWPEDRIVLLTDTDATGAMIREGLAWLARTSTDDATVVFHYSGHSKKSYGPGRRIDDQALWPTDDDFVWRDELADRLGEVAHDRLWGNIATCEAAGFHLEGVAAPGRLWTYSSRADEKSYEDPTHDHSVWGRFLLRDQLWDAGPDAPSVQDAFVTASANAATYTSAQVPYGPQVPVLHDDLGRPFELVP